MRRRAPETAGAFKQSNERNCSLPCQSCSDCLAALRGWAIGCLCTAALLPGLRSLQGLVRTALLFAAGEAWQQAGPTAHQLALLSLLELDRTGQSRVTAVLRPAPAARRPTELRACVYLYSHRMAPPQDDHVVKRYAPRSYPRSGSSASANSARWKMVTALEKSIELGTKCRQSFASSVV